MSPVRTVEIAFLGNIRDLESKLERAGIVGKASGDTIGDSFTKGTSRAGGAVEKLGQLGANLGIPFAGSLTVIGKHLDETDSKARKLHGTLAAAGKVAAFGGLAAFGAAAYEGVKGAVALEKQMMMLHTQAGASEKEVASLTGAVESMAGSVGTGPQKLSESLFHVESAGLRGSKAMEVLKTAAQGAAVGHANLVDVQNALDAAVVSGISGVQNYQQAMGALNATVGAGDMTMQDLADALGTGVLAPMKRFGLNIQDVGAALAVFGDNNIRGQDAATKLTSAVRIMAAPSTAASKALGTIGLSTLQLASDMRSGGLVKALSDLQSHLKGSGATAEQQSLIIARAFGGRQSLGVQVLLGQLSRLEEKEHEVGKGAKGFHSAWEETTHTLGFAFESAKASVEGLADKLGFALIPELRAAGGALADGAHWLEKHKTAAQALGVVITGVLGTAVAVFAYDKAVAFGKGVERMVSGLGRLVGVSGATAVKVEADQAAQAAAAEAASAKIGAASAESAAAVQAEAAKMQTSFFEIDSGFATQAAAAETASGQMQMTFASVEAGVAGEAGAVTAADTAIEAENVAAGASFTAMLGPIGAVVAALVAAQPLINELTGGGLGETEAEGKAAHKFGGGGLPSGGNVTKADAFLQHSGLSPAVAAGITKVLEAEAGRGLPTTSEGKEGAYGIAQWLGSRRKGLEKFAGEAGTSGNSLQTQLDYLMAELHGPEARTLKKLSGAHTSRQAEEIFVKDFERPESASGVLARSGQYHITTGSSHSDAASHAQKVIADAEKKAQGGLSTKAQEELGLIPSESTKKKHAAALGVPAGVTAMLATAKALLGTRYTSGGGHDGWDPIEALKKIGVDCSGFVSQVLHRGGVLSTPADTTLLPHEKGIASGAGKYVTIYDRPKPGNEGHELINILGKWFESGGNSQFNPKGGVSMLSAAQAKGELGGGGFEAFHPTALNKAVRGGANQSALLKGLAPQEAELEAFIKHRAEELKALEGRGKAELQRLQGIGSHSLLGAQKLLGATTSSGAPASQQQREFQQLIAALRATHEKGMVQLADKLAAVHRTAEAQLGQKYLDAQREALAAEERASAQALEFQTAQARDQTQIVSDMASSVEQSMRDASQAITDSLAAQATAIKDQTREMSDASSAAVQQIQDQSQLTVDKLAERGLYGLALVAQQQKVQLDEMKIGYDAQIAHAQQAIDTAQTATDRASAATQALVDAVTSQQNVLIGQAQQNLDNVTKTNNLAVQEAQAAVARASTGSQAQQEEAAAQLQHAEAAAAAAVQQAQAALAAAQAHASQAEQEAQNALASAQGNASVVLAQAEQTLAAAQSQADRAEAEQQALIARTEEEANMQYAGSGLTVNIEGINPTDAAAVASEVGWILRTQVPA
jgi:TP901 family phage tail tape measure protein